MKQRYKVQADLGAHLLVAPQYFSFFFLLQTRVCKEEKEIVMVSACSALSVLIWLNRLPFSKAYLDHFQMAVVK